MTQQRPHVQITFTPPEPTTTVVGGDERDDAAHAPLHTEMGGVGVWVIWSALLVMLVGVVFGPSLGGSFIWGDDVNVTQNSFLRVWQGMHAIWRLPHTFPQFSPLGYTSLLFDYRLFGRSSHAAAGFRFTNVALHAVNVVLLWSLLRKLEVPGGWIAAAAWAVHPLQVQPVVWVSQRPVLLGTTLLLSSLLVYLRYAGVNPAPFYEYRRPLFRLPERPWMVWAIGFVLVILTALALPVAATIFPLIVLLLVWWERGEVTRHDVKPLIPFFVISLLTIAGAIALTYYRHRSGTLAESSAITRLLTAGTSAWLYVFWTVLPIKVAFAHPPRDASIHDVWSWIAICVAFIVLWRLWAMRRRIGRGPFAAAMLFVIALLPAWIVPSTQAMTPRDIFIADAMLYVALAAPIVAIVAIVALAAERSTMMNRPMIGGWLSGAIVVVLAALALWHERPYRDAETLWGEVIDKHPRLVAARLRLADLEMSRNRPDAADAQYRQVLATDAKNLDALLGEARVQEHGGDWDQALSTYTLILHIQPDNPSAHFGLAKVWSHQGDSAGAIRECETVLQLRPRDDQAMAFLASVYDSRGETDKAIEWLRKSIDVNARNVDAHLYLAALYFSNFDVDAAAAQLDAAVKLDRDNYRIYVNAAAMMGAWATKQADAGHMDNALTLFGMAETYSRRAYQLEPKSSEACFNLGVALAAQARRDPRRAGKMQEAVFYFGRATQLAPENQQYQQAYQAIQRDAAQMSRKGGAR